MATNPDFKDLFAALFDAQADFIVVGAHAVMVYTEPRDPEPRIVEALA
jgi:hypothetical protein